MQLAKKGSQEEKRWRSPRAEPVYNRCDVVYQPVNNRFYVSGDSV